MATFGSLAGRVDPARDYLAEALGPASAALGQGIAQGAQNFAAGMQRNKELDAQKKQQQIVMMERDLNEVESQANRMASTPGADPMQIEQWRTSAKGDVYKKYNPEDDNINKAINQPQQQSAPKPQAPQAPQQSQVTQPAPSLTVGGIYQGARDNQAKAEADKNNREQLETYRKTARDLRMTDDVIDTDPALEPYRGRSLEDWQNIAAIAQQREAERKERVAARLERIKAGVEKVKSEDELRREYTKELTPYKEIIEKEGNVTTLLGQGSVQSDMAALKLYARMLEPGVVTEGDIRILSRAGGVCDTIQKEIGQAITGDALTPAARERLRSAVSAVAGNARQGISGLNEHYSEIALASGRRPGQIINTGFNKPRQPQQQQQQGGRPVEEGEFD